MFNLTT